MERNRRKKLSFEVSQMKELLQILQGSMYRSEDRRSVSAKEAAKRNGKRPNVRKKQAMPEIIRLMEEGHTNRAIGLKLNLSGQTVNNWMKEYLKEKENAESKTTSPRR